MTDALIPPTKLAEPSPIGTADWTQPGIYRHVPEADYHAAPLASHSSVRQWIRAKKLGRVGVIGSALHCLALEGREALDARFVTSEEDWDMRTADGKARAAEIIGDSGKDLLRQKERAQVERMFQALGHHPTARKILDAEGENELTVVGKFDGLKQLYRCRLDMLRKASIWDLKTTSHVNEEAWLDAEVEYGYINQAEWYSSLYAALTDRHLKFGFLCVSKREPNNVWARIVPPQLMALGRKWREDVLTLYERYVPKELANATK